MSFKNFFSNQSKFNICRIALMMASADIIVSTVRALIDLKHLKFNIIELYPIFYAFLWLIICCQAWSKDGDYGAPPSLFYLQE